MSRLQKVVLAIASTLLTFALVTGVLAYSAYRVGQWPLVERELTQPFLGVPLVLGFFAVALVLGLALTTLTSLVVRHNLRHTDTALDALLADQYDDTAFAPPATFMTSTNVAVVEKLRRLRDKLQTLQANIQTMADQPIIMGNQTKEEILQDERHRLARELHDSVSQQLFAATMMLSALNATAAKEDLPETLTKQIVTIEKVINEAQSEMRALLLHLRPINLEGKSLQAGIISLLNELKTKVQIKITVDIAPLSLPSAIEDNLFRIVQELLSNTLRHAKATTIEVYLKQIGQTVLLKVVDNGVGFEQKTAQAAGSYGLQNISERTKSMGGSLHIVSFPQQGTSVEVRVPIVKETTNSDD